MNFNCLIKKSEQTISVMVMMYWATKNSLRDTTDPPVAVDRTKGNDRCFAAIPYERHQGGKQRKQEQNPAIEQ